MARKRYNEEDILRLLREIEVHLHGGMDVVSACHTAPSPTLFAKNRKACPVMSLAAEALSLRCEVGLSRNCAAPLTAYYALKENTHGKQTNSRI